MRGQKVLLAAADTFRAAAREQLAVWADRRQRAVGRDRQPGRRRPGGGDLRRGGRRQGARLRRGDRRHRRPPADAAAPDGGAEEDPARDRQGATRGAPHEVLLVIDGNTGQNALAQVKAFDDALQLTGLIVTKLDGTAKGGVLAAIALWARERAAERRRPAAAGLLHRRRREAGRPGDLQRARVRAGAAELSTRRRWLSGDRRCPWPAAHRGRRTRSTTPRSIATSCGKRRRRVARISSISATGISGIGREPPRFIAPCAVVLQQRGHLRAHLGHAGQRISRTKCSTLTCAARSTRVMRSCRWRARELCCAGRMSTTAITLRALVAHHEVGALAADRATPTGVGVARGHAQKARQRHLRQHHVLRQRAPA